MKNIKKTALYKKIWSITWSGWFILCIPFDLLLGKDMFIHKDIKRNTKKFDSYVIDIEQLNSNIKKKMIYSFGIGTDVKFELKLAEELKENVEIYAFDPTPMALNYVKSIDLPFNITVVPKGLSSTDCKSIMYFPVNSDNPSMSAVKHKKMTENSIMVDMMRMKTIMKELGHDYIDIVKMDIEGSEYAVIDDILDSGCQFGQLCVEFHHRHLGGGIRGGVAYTKKAIKKLHDYGYKIVYVSSRRMEVTFSKCDIS